jgi:hypothetical protein
MQCLSLHAFKHDSFDVGPSHSRGEKGRVHCCKLPRTKSFPHGVHCSWSQRNKIGECRVEEEYLVIFVVVEAV